MANETPSVTEHGHEKAGPASPAVARVSRAQASRDAIANAVGDIAARRSSPSAPRVTRTPQHPLEDMSRERRSDVYDLDPKRIDVEGEYVRAPDKKGESFETFVAKVKVKGEITHPILARIEGPPANRRIVLVAGRRRLEAARILGLPRIPVRLLGGISMLESLSLQFQENMLRQSMAAIEIAWGFARMENEGGTRRDMMDASGKSEGYVSYMLSVGQCLTLLTADEVTRLARPGVLIVRDCQSIAKLPSIEERAGALREFLVRAERRGPRGDGEGTETESESADPDSAAMPTPTVNRRAPRARQRGREAARSDERTPFIGRDIRNGRSFRLRWDDGMLAQPERFLAQLRATFAQELVHLSEHLASLAKERTTAKRNRSPGGEDAAVFRRASTEAKRLADHIAKSNRA